MATNEITLKLTANDNGSFDLVAKKAKSASTAVEGVSKATNKANNSQDSFNKKAKGVAGATSNSTKAFSKQAQTLNSGSSSVVAAYATLAANIFAITAAFGALRRAAGLEQLEQGLIRVGSAAGQNLPVVADSLREITGEAVSLQEAMSAVALGSSAGFSTEQLEGLTTVAKGASLALGRDMADALNRLTRGAAKLEPEILDELGIMVRLDDATEQYATTLGKTASQLTQFERRMAFTNAIIDQGTDKFDAIAQSIDPNPYDKLAATFDNLTKSLFNIFNVALKPLVSFLADNGTVLIGVLTLFGTTISKQMLPQLSRAAEQSRDMAEALANQSQEQLGSLKSTSKGVAVYNKLLPKLQKGSATIKEQEEALRSLTRSETLHRAQLARMTQETPAEIAAYREKSLVVNQVTKAKTTLVAAIKAEGLATAQSLKTDGLALLQKGKLLDGIHLLTQGVLEEIAAEKLAAKQTGTHIGVLGGLKLAFKTTALSAKAFGTALLSALPIIGQAILTVGLLWSVLSPLIERFKTNDIDEFTESFESFAEINTQLKDTIRGTNDELEIYVAKLRVSVGVIDQITGAIKTLQSTRSGSVREAIKEQFDIIDNAEKQIKLLSRQGSGTELVIRRQKRLIKEAKEEIELIREKQGLLDSSSARAILKESIIQAESAGILTDEIERQVSALDHLIASDNITTWDEFWTAATGITIINRATLGNIDGIRDSVSALNKELIRLRGKKEGPYEKLIGSLTEFKTASDSAFEKGQKDYNNYVALVRKKAPELVDQLTLGGNVPFAVGLKQAIKILEDYQESIVLATIRIQKHKDTIKSLSSIISSVPAAVTKSFNEQREINKDQLEIINNQLSASNLINLDANEINRLKEERNRLEDLSNLSAKEVLAFSQAEVAIKNSLLQLQNKEIANKKQLLEDESTLARNALVRAAIEDKFRTNKALTAEEELQLFEQQKTARIDLIKQETELKLESIDLEYQLLAAKFDFLKAQAKINDVELPTGFVDKYENALFNAQVSAVEAAFSVQENALDALLTKSTTKAQTFKESIATATNTGDTTTDRIKSTGFATKGTTASLEGLDTLQSQVQGVDNILSPMQEALKSMGPEGEFVGTVVQGAFAITEAWSGVAATLNSDIPSGMKKASAIAGAAAATFAQIGQISAAASRNTIAGIDEQIEAEKKRDGKSKESLAKIQALEAKKESAKKKAFETNKKVQMASVVMSTASAIIAALAPPPLGLGPVFGPIVAGMAGALGAAQLAVIAGTSYSGGAGGASANVPSSVSIGDRSNSVDLANAKNAPGELAYIRGQRGIGSNATNFTPAFTGVQHRATGGATTGFMVGEQGPELFVPDTPGVIKPADEATNTSAPMNVNFTVNAIDSKSVEEMLTNNRSTIIRELRQAANQHGEFFLETVREESLT